jgi:hypothetical protein
MPTYQTRQMPSLLPVQQMHPQNGPSLPLGSQLYRLLQLQVLPQHAFLCKFTLPNHSFHIEQTGVKRSEQVRC